MHTVSPRRYFTNPLLAQQSNYQSLDSCCKWSGMYACDMLINSMYSHNNLITHCYWRYKSNGNEKEIDWSNLNNIIFALFALFFHFFISVCVAFFLFLLLPSWQLSFFCWTFSMHSIAYASVMKTGNSKSIDGFVKATALFFKFIQFLSIFHGIFLKLATVSSSYSSTPCMWRLILFWPKTIRKTILFEQQTPEWFNAVASWT